MDITSVWQNARSCAEIASAPLWIRWHASRRRHRYIETLIPRWRSLIVPPCGLHTGGVSPISCPLCRKPFALPRFGETLFFQSWQFSRDGISIGRESLVDRFTSSFANSSSSSSRDKTFVSSSNFIKFYLFIYYYFFNVLSSTNVKLLIYLPCLKKYFIQKFHYLNTLYLLDFVYI